MSRIRQLFPKIQNTLFSRFRKNKGSRSKTKKDNSVHYIKHICLYNLGEYFENTTNNTFEDILPKDGKVISEINDRDYIYNKNIYYLSSKEVKEVAERSRRRFKILHTEYNKILESKGKEEEVPEEYTCTTISLDIMMFPVTITSDTIHTYEKDRIMTIIEKGGKWIYSREKVTIDMIRRDTDKEDEIENYIKKLQDMVQKEDQIGTYIKKLQDSVKKENAYSVGGRIYFKKRRKVNQTKRRRYKNKYSKKRC